MLLSVQFLVCLRGRRFIPPLAGRMVMMMKAADYFIIVGTEMLSLNFLSWVISVIIIRKHVNKHIPPSPQS